MEAMKEAQIANQAKTEFLANMSHELRTPLNAVIGFSNILKDEILGPLGHPQYHEYSCDIFNSGQHLLSLINDILELSKIESGAGELHEEDVNIPETVHSIMKLLAENIRNRQIALVVDVAKDTPALRADAGQLKQILVNLLSNAIKFTETNGAVSLEVWSNANSGYVFQVTDTGIGIAIEDIPKALAPFQQIDGGLSRKQGGTGLGLPLTKSLIELHGGSLDLQSTIGVGTTVTVRFPANRIVNAPRGVENFHANVRKIG
jgi:signal transduction histidine kinase